MKPFLFFAISFFAIQLISAQNASIVSNENIYNSAGIEVKPEFSGGMEKFYQFIGDNYITPTSGDFLGGKVYVSFVIVSKMVSSGAKWKKS